MIVGPVFRQPRPNTDPFTVRNPFLQHAVAVQVVVLVVEVVGMVMVVSWQ